LPVEAHQLHPLTVEGPLPGTVGLFPELLHLRHMLWRVPDGRGVVPFYREKRPELFELAQKLPAPPEATTLADAYALVA
jgi:hypothetical protein